MKEDFGVEKAHPKQLHCGGQAKIEDGAEEIRPLESKSQKQKNRKKTGGFLGLTMELVSIVIGAFLFAFLIRTFVVQPFFVKGQSMEPNYFEKEYLVIDEISYRFRDPKRGEVVVFKYPKDPSTYFIKRVIGLPNEIISIKNGKIVIYNKEHEGGVELGEPYLSDNVYTAGDIYVTLGENEFYVLGDNRPRSSDSRQWGVLDRKYITGRTWLRIWPLNQFSLINDNF